MICPSCKSAADTLDGKGTGMYLDPQEREAYAKNMHAECRGCDCQHGQSDAKPRDEVPTHLQALGPHVRKMISSADDFVRGVVVDMRKRPDGPDVQMLGTVMTRRQALALINEAPAGQEEALPRMVGPGILTLELDENSGLPLGISFCGEALPYAVHYRSGPGAGSPWNVVIRDLRTEQV